MIGQFVFAKNISFTLLGAFGVTNPFAAQTFAGKSAEISPLGKFSAALTEPARAGRINPNEPGKFVKTLTGGSARRPVIRDEMLEKVFMNGKIGDSDMLALKTSSISAVDRSPNGLINFASPSVGYNRSLNSNLRAERALCVDRRPASAGRLSARSTVF